MSGRSSPRVYRIAHRLRDMQTLPYIVVTNPHISHVYELYYKAFDRLRRIPEIKTVDDNDRYCKIITETLREHLSVIPRLAMGVLEIQGLMKPEDTDKFMTTLLRSVRDTQLILPGSHADHLRPPENITPSHSRAAPRAHRDLPFPWHFPDANMDPNIDAVGEIFLRCSAKEIVERCAKTITELVGKINGSTAHIPEVRIYGHLDATFPYIQSHLEYIIGELLRNSIQAVIERRHQGEKPPPIEVLVCETPQHVIIRISDRGGGVPKEILPYLWSFSKGPRSQTRLKNLRKVPALVATMQELKIPTEDQSAHDTKRNWRSAESGGHASSLSSLTSRPPDLRLGIGLPMSKIYAEYWAGSLELHSLEGWGVDAFLQISKLGNKNEQLITRASQDAV
ncbi:putative protein kinase [Coniosporium tulheliwenetii]|uniref:Uncharacterized protein n=1 Tax=Coniosporium tulheliwenetii TaxID=3383036 RepID=A0ACC2YWV1_9PEZI|nr:putative protein kinase [Cladosporium sp. JES 115]